MPAIEIHYLEGLLDALTWNDSVEMLRVVTAASMQAENLDDILCVLVPVAHIDVLAREYSPITSRTAAVMIMIIAFTYGWSDRMRNITERLLAIADYVRLHVPARLVYEGQNAVNATFLAKGPGCWVAR